MSQAIYSNIICKSLHIDLIWRRKKSLFNVSDDNSNKPAMELSKYAVYQCGIPLCNITRNNTYQIDINLIELWWSTMVRILLHVLIYGVCAEVNNVVTQ